MLHVKIWRTVGYFVYLRKIKVMREWYEFNRDAVKEFLKKPVEGIISFLFIALVFYILYFALWVFCPC